LDREVRFLGQEQWLVDWAVNEPSCGTGWIEFDHEIMNHPVIFSHNEIHYIVGGKAEYIYTSHPKHAEEQRVVVEDGDLCLIRYGTLLKVRPLDRPFRVVFVVMPMPEVPYRPYE
jgi:hypothetical protein